MIFDTNQGPKIRQIFNCYFLNFTEVFKSKTKSYSRLANHRHPTRTGENVVIISAVDLMQRRNFVILL